MSETVDVLMATYETNPHYLKQQIDSILSQTYTDIHLIISDDNSTSQDVQSILKEVANSDKRVELHIQEQNIGYIKNFEFLLTKSNADYICFSDHDDIWNPEKIEKQLQTLKQNDVDMVYCNCMQIDEQGKIIHENYFQYKNMPLVNGKHQILGMSRYLGIGCSQIFTRAVKEKMLPFNTNVMAQDWLVSFIANENKGVSYIEEPLFLYRRHTGNIFGGRSLAQNLKRWKEKYGSTYKGYLQYRKEAVIEPAYLDGAKMCLSYATEEATKNILEKLIQYYEKLEKTKYINLNIKPYFQYLGGKNMRKKAIKELMIFHIPILGYLRYIL